MRIFDRTAPSVIALLLAAATTLISSRALGAGQDWPRFLGPAGDGKSAEGPVTWPAAGPPVLWHHEVGEGYSMPSVADGRLFLFDRLGDRARLTCLDARTGEERWQSTYETAYEDYYGYSVGPRAMPLVDGERVYSFGVEGRLRAHRVSDGKLLWDVDTAARFGVVQNFFGVGASPIVEGDLLIAQIGGSPPDSPRVHSGQVQGAGSGLVAFDKKTGEVCWQATDELASYASLQAATIGDRRWGFAFTRGGLVGFAPATGKVDFFFPWRAKKLESVNASTPVVVGDRVFVTESYGPGGALLQVRPGGYEVVWKDQPRKESLASHWSTAVHHDGVLYGSSGQSRGNAELRAVDLDTGEVLWSEPGLGRSTLLYVDGHFVVLTEGGKILWVKADPERYAPLAELELVAGKNDPGGLEPGTKLLTFPAWNAPVLAQGLLYVRGKDRLVALELIPTSQPRKEPLKGTQTGPRP